MVTGQTGRADGRTGDAEVSYRISTALAVARPRSTHYEMTGCLFADGTRFFDAAIRKQTTNAGILCPPLSRFTTHRHVAESQQQKNESRAFDGRPFADSKVAVVATIQSARRFLTTSTAGFTEAMHPSMARFGKVLCAADSRRQFIAAVIMTGQPSLFRR